MKLLIPLCSALLVLPLAAAPVIRSEQVQFENGKSAASIKGHITGHEIVDYQLTAKAGQHMSVKFTTSRGTNYFNVLAPGSDTPLYVGSMSETKTYQGKLPADGKYTIRLYQMGGAKDSDLRADYTLGVSITDEAPVAFDRKVSLHGIDFHVTVTTGPDGKSKLLVTPTGLEIDNSPIETTLTGSVTGAEVGDLNADGSPELYVFLQLPGDDARGQLLAWSANKKKSLSEIFLSGPAPDAPQMEDYRGHDEYAVVENIIARRFPISKDGAETAKYRQLQYKLEPGEAAWQLKLDKSTEF